MMFSKSTLCYLGWQFFEMGAIPAISQKSERNFAAIASKIAAPISSFRTDQQPVKAPNNTSGFPTRKGECKVGLQTANTATV